MFSRNFGRDHIFLQVTEVTDLSQRSRFFKTSSGGRGRRWEKVLGTTNLLLLLFYLALASLVKR